MEGEQEIRRVLGIEEAKRFRDMVNSVPYPYKDLVSRTMLKAIERINGKSKLASEFGIHGVNILDLKRINVIGKLGREAGVLPDGRLAAYSNGEMQIQETLLQQVASGTVSEDFLASEFAHEAFHAVFPQFKPAVEAHFAVQGFSEKGLEALVAMYEELMAN